MVLLPCTKAARPSIPFLRCVYSVTRYTVFLIANSFSMSSALSILLKWFLRLHSSANSRRFLRMRFLSQLVGKSVFPVQWLQYLGTLFCTVYEVTRNMCLGGFHFVDTILSQKFRFAGIPDSTLSNFFPALPFLLLQAHLLCCSYTFPPCSFYSIGAFSTVQVAPMECFVHFILLHEYFRKKTGDYLALTLAFAISNIDT